MRRMSSQRSPCQPLPLPSTDLRERAGVGPEVLPGAGGDVADHLAAPAVQSGDGRRRSCRSRRCRRRGRRREVSSRPLSCHCQAVPGAGLPARGRRRTAGSCVRRRPSIRPGRAARRRAPSSAPRSSGERVGHREASSSAYGSGTPGVGARSGDRAVHGGAARPACGPPAGPPAGHAVHQMAEPLRRMVRGPVGGTARPGRCPTGPRR